jgi:hypothetical protein
MIKALLAEARSKAYRSPGKGIESLTPKGLEIFLFDAWVTMLFRGCCWGACHEFVPGERVPSEWWGSQFADLYWMTSTFESHFDLLFQTSTVRVPRSISMSQ